ncbi:MAG: creatininase family protein [Candidatus Bathyarchaeia archaeon]
MNLIELNSTKASQLIGKIDTLIIPVGTIEAHGPHCTILSDVLTPQRVAEEVDAIAGDRILVAPTIPYGHTQELREYPGSHAVPGKALADYVFEVIKGFQTWKIKNVVLLNGHGAVGGGAGGNIEPLHDAAERASQLGIRTIVLSWWAPHKALRGVAEDVEGHAGETETSLLMYLGDSYVDKSLIPKLRHNFSMKTDAEASDVFDPELSKRLWPMAFSGNPAAASKEKGKAINELVVKSIVEVIDAMRAGTLVSL